MEKQSILAVLSESSNKMSPKKFFYAHTSVPCSDIIREASFCSSWKQVQRTIARQYTEN